MPTPIKFEIEKNGVWRLVKVDKIISTEETRPSGMHALIFKCQSEIHGVEKQYEIAFRIKPHRWELYKA